MTRFFKPSNPGSRHRNISDFKDVSLGKRDKKLTVALLRCKGRNNRGIITSRHRGGGHKRLYRYVDHHRSKIGMVGVVKAIHYDPYRNARLALIYYQDGTKQYILQGRGLKPGTNVLSSVSAPISEGNSLPLKNIPLGTQVHNLECFPGGGGKLIRAAGAVGQLVAKEKKYAAVRLPSGEVRLFLRNCWATIGQVGHEDCLNITLGKAGATRWKGRRPKVRGSAMNPCDHPHGGGEGRSPIGRVRPVSLWGKAALGVRTRTKKKYSTPYIIQRRKGFNRS